VHALRSEPAARTLTPRDVALRHRPGAASAAWLLAGWLRCALKWSGRDALPRIEESVQGDDLVVISLSGSGWKVTGTMTPQHIDIATEGAQPAFRVPVPGETAADAIVAELQMLGYDSCLRDVVIALAGVPA
jgi:hypothetical protein